MSNTQTEYQNVINYNTNVSNTSYPLLKKTGVWSREGFTNSSSMSNSESMEYIINSLNENLSQLDYIHTQINSVNNINQDALLKRSKLIEMENEDLKSQLAELEIIQANIANKDRMIEQTNYNIMNQDLTIYVLVVASVLALFLILSIALYGYKTITAPVFGSIVSVIVVAYIILYIYSYNIFYFRDSISYLKNRKNYSLNLGHELKKWGKIKSNVNNAIESNREAVKNQWIANNCSCPPEEEAEEEEAVATEEEEEYSSGGGTKFEKEIPGYFYKDQSSPQQLIVPSPDPVKLKLNENINWVDYSPNGDVLYDSNRNKNLYVNTKYYNFKPINTNEQKLINIVNNKPDALTGSTTFTANI